MQRQRWTVIVVSSVRSSKAGRSWPLTRQNFALAAIEVAARHHDF